MNATSAFLRAVARVLVGLTVAFGAAWGTLLILERLLFAGWLGLADPESTLLDVGQIVAPVAIGCVAAYLSDRVWVRQREGSRTIGQRSADPAQP